MARIHITGTGEALDLICWREYGAQAGVAEQVLEANPHVAETAHALPPGISVTLPDLSAQASAASTPRLWD